MNVCVGIFSCASSACKFAFVTIDTENAAGKIKNIEVGEEGMEKRGTKQKGLLTCITYAMKCDSRNLLKVAVARKV